MSPELLDPERFGSKNSRPTKESDCYALGMVIYEVLSGQVPFTLDRNFTVMRKVTGGERPVRPEGVKGLWFTDDLWGILKQCWMPQPGDRPSIEAVLQCLERVSRTWKPHASQTDEDAEMGRALTPMSDFSGMAPYFKSYGGFFADHTSDPLLVLTPTVISTHLPAGLNLIPSTPGAAWVVTYEPSAQKAFNVDRVPPRCSSELVFTHRNPPMWCASPDTSQFTFTVPSFPLSTIPLGLRMPLSYVEGGDHKFKFLTQLPQT
jgi:hypothetical protein